MLRWKAMWTCTQIISAQKDSERMTQTLDTISRTYTSKIPTMLRWKAMWTFIQITSVQKDAQILDTISRTHTSKIPTMLRWKAIRMLKWIQKTSRKMITRWRSQVTHTINQNVRSKRNRLIRFKIQELWKFRWFKRLSRLYGYCCDFRRFVRGSVAVLCWSQMVRSDELFQIGQQSQMVQTLFRMVRRSDGQMVR